MNRRLFLQLLSAPIVIPKDTVVPKNNPWIVTWEHPHYKTLDKLGEDIFTWNSFLDLPAQKQVVISWMICRISKNINTGKSKLEYGL